MMELLIPALVGVLSAAFGGVAVALVNRKKIDAEAHKLGVDAEQVELHGQLEVFDRSMEFNNTLIKRVEKLEGDAAKREKDFASRMDKLEQEMAALEKENEALRDRCRALEGENARMRRKLGEGQGSGAFGKGFGLGRPKDEQEESA